MFATILAEVQDHRFHHDAAMVSDHQGGRFRRQRPVQLERYQTMETNFFQKTVRQQRIRSLQHARERRLVESALAAGGHDCLHRTNGSHFCFVAGRGLYRRSEVLHCDDAR